MFGIIRPPKDFGSSKYLNILLIAPPGARQASPDRQRRPQPSGADLPWSPQRALHLRCGRNRPLVPLRQPRGPLPAAQPRRRTEAGRLRERSRRRDSALSARGEGPLSVQHSAGKEAAGQRLDRPSVSSARGRDGTECEPDLQTPLSAPLG